VVTEYDSSISSSSTAVSSTSSAGKDHHGLTGCRHAFTLNSCPASLALPGYCGLYTANASSAFCAGHFVYRHADDTSYVFFFSPRLRAWQATNMEHYNLTLVSLCGSSWGDIFVNIPQILGSPGKFVNTNYDPVIGGKSASNLVWFDSDGVAHHQSSDNSTSLHLAPLQNTLPLDRRGMLKMYHCGPVMTEPTSIYLIFYGSWNQTREGPVLSSMLPILISGLASTPYWEVLTSAYFNASGKSPYPSQSPLITKPCSRRCASHVVHAGRR